MGGIHHSAAAAGTQAWDTQYICVYTFLAYTHLPFHITLIQLLKSFKYWNA